MAKTQTFDIVKTAADAMGISEKHLKNCINEYPDGYFVWEPVSGGKTAFIDREGRALVAESGTPFRSLYDEFRKGKRGRMELLPIIKEEIDIYFSIDGGEE